MIVEGRKWIKARVSFLEELLAGLPEGEAGEPQRTAINAELSALRGENRVGRRGLSRWFHLGHRPPDL